MSNLYVLDEAGNPIRCKSVLKWGRFFENSDLRRVAEDQIGDQRVSTVFLGIDHRFGEGPPVLYETMIFGGPHDEFQERYNTKAEAVAGHEAACRMARRALAGEDES